MKVLVTGACGFIGSHVVEELVSAGHDVVGIDNMSTPEPVIPKCSLEVVDITDRDALAAAFPQSVDCVIHLAARPGVGWSVDNPDECRRINVGGTENVLSVASERGAGRIVFASSSTVYGFGQKSRASRESDRLAPVSPYGDSKAEGERACRGCGISCAILRLFSVFGPGMRRDLAMRRIADSLNPECPVFRVRGDGTSERDYTYVEDVARAMRIAAESKSSGAFNICAGNPRALRDVISEMERFLGEPPNIGWGGDAVATWEPHRTWGDNSKAGRILGWYPREDFHEGLRKFIDWWKGKTSRKD